MGKHTTIETVQAYKSIDGSLHESLCACNARNTAILTRQQQLRIESRLRPLFGINGRIDCATIARMWPQMIAAVGNPDV